MVIFSPFALSLLCTEWKYLLLDSLIGSCSLRAARGLSFWSVASTKVHFEWRMSVYVGRGGN